MARPLAEVAARDGGLAPVAGGEVGTTSPLVAMQIALLALPVALLLRN